MLVNKLPNGLTLIVKPVKNKVVTLDCWVNVGSANEPANLNGISHFLEHMLFKGTPRYGVGELDKTIMNVGGVWNAGTSKDFTHYHVTVASPFFDTALDCISDMIQHAAIDKGEFDREKSVILEEYRRKQDSPTGVLYDDLYEIMYKSGPYRQSVLGTFESISALTRDDMYDYYQRFYTPDNMAFVVVGDIDPGAVTAGVSKVFGDFDHRKVRPLLTEIPPTDFASDVSRTEKKDVNECYLGIGFPAPPINDERAVLAMDAAVTILGDGRSSRLYQRIKEQKRLAHAVSAGFPTHREQGFIYGFGTTERPKIDALRAEIVAVMRELADTGPTDDELAKAKRVLTNQLYYGTETNPGQSSTLGYYYTLTGSNEFLDRYIDELKGLTPNDIREVLKDRVSGEPNSVLIEPADSGKGETA